MATVHDVFKRCMYPVFGHTVPYNTSLLQHILFVMNIVLLLWAESKTKGVCHTLTRSRKKGRIGMWKKVWDGCTHSNLQGLKYLFFNTAHSDSGWPF